MSNHNFSKGWLVLLISFLDVIGLKNSAEVQASKADVGNVAMSNHNFSKGWLTECEEFGSLSSKASTTTPPGACRLPSGMEVIQFQGDATPIDIDTVVEVACKPGFK